MSNDIVKRRMILEKKKRALVDEDVKLCIEERSLWDDCPHKNIEIWPSEYGFPRTKFCLDCGWAKELL